ncbi:MAG: hypothetical protein Q9165_000850 [Trypethelium subeluteriae]
MNSEFQNDYESLLNDVSLQMASSQLSRRNSRSSKRHSGTPSRRSIRVEKPPTAHNSPHILQRRRTTTSVQQYASLDDHYNAMFGSPKPETEHYANDNDKSVVRPMSWHPSASTAIRSGLKPTYSKRQSVHVPSIPAAYRHSDYAARPTFTDGGYDLQASDAGSEIPLSTDGGSVDLALWNRYTTACSWPLMAHIDPCVASDLGLLPDAPEDWSSAIATFPQPVESITVQAPTEIQADFRSAQDSPMPQNVAEHTLRTQRSKDSSKSLVGMGLYDSPEPLTSSWRIHMDGYQSWLAPDLVQSSGKGLKLEETFEPPPDHGEDGEEDEEDDHGSSEDEVQEEPPSMDDPRLHVTVASNQPPSLAGQSFFFDDDEAYSNDWWYGLTKNAPAPDAALEYGWI